jgi:hypothetical protein
MATTNGGYGGTTGCIGQYHSRIENDNLIDSFDVSMSNLIGSSLRAHTATNKAKLNNGVC